MLEKERVEEVLGDFAEYVISESKGNLVTMGKVASSSLLNSFEYGFTHDKKEISLEIFMDEHGAYVDKGVSGIKKKYNTEFSYKSKGGLKGMPPPSAFDKWNVIKGRGARDDKGRFLSRKQLNFRTAVGVFMYGIKPTGFFTTPFEAAFQSLPNDISEAYGDDFEKLIKIKLNVA